jgi:SAM-dependent methyltransferase
VSGDDHVSTARDVFDRAAASYVRLVGTEMSSATELPVDQSWLVEFVELTTRRAIGRVADVGCGPGRVAAFLADRGLDVIGVDVSRAMLAVARTAHPDIPFEEGRLDALPIETGALAGVVCWYSIMYTPLDRLDDAFDELARALIPGGCLLLAFQAEGEPVQRDDAFGTHLPLTSYRHRMQEVAACLARTGYTIHATALRAPELEHESAPQGFVIATSRFRL